MLRISSDLKLELLNLIKKKGGRSQLARLWISLTPLFFMLNIKELCANFEELYNSKEEYMNELNQTVENHKNKIWKATDGRYATYIDVEIRGENVRKLIKATKKNDLEKKIFEAEKLKELASSPTIDIVFKGWIDWKLKMGKISESTVLRYQQDYDRYYGEMGKRPIKFISEAEWIDFLEYQIPLFELTSKGFSNLKTITRGILKYAKREKIINYNADMLFDELDVTERDFKKVIKEDDEEIFDDNEWNSITNYLIASDKERDKAILLMFLTGVRVGELVSLKHSDIDGLSVKIRRTETRVRASKKHYMMKVKNYPKTKAGVRTVFVPKEYGWLIEEINKLNPNSEYLFTYKDEDRITANAIRERLYRICEELNITKKSPHKARKTYGTILLDNNVDNRLVTDVMGHTDISVTEKHYHRNRKSIDKKIEIISNIPEFVRKV